jgi:Flp pilus assembly secretin CpaC
VSATRRFQFLIAVAFALAAGEPLAHGTPPTAQSEQPVAQTPASTQTSGSTPAAPDAAPHTEPKLPTGSERRRAAKFFLEGSGLYQNQQFEQALRDYGQAAALDPANADYTMAVEVARSHAVTALIQTAARDRTRGDLVSARATLTHALELDPRNQDVALRLANLIPDPSQESSEFAGTSTPPFLASPLQLAPSAGLHSFHLHLMHRQLIQQVFKAYGIDAVVDTSVRATIARLDVDDVAFAEVARLLCLLTDSFYVPIDTRQVIVARNTYANRQQFQHNAVETFSLSGLTSNEMTEMGNIARNVFEVQQAAVDQSAATLTLRTTPANIRAFNATLNDLMEGVPQVLLDVRVIQLAHNNERNTGAQLPQTITAFNVYAEEQQLLQQNASLVQQIIASGLAKPGDTLAILAILLASGQISSSIFSNGFALFGGGLTLSGISPGPATLNLDLNSSQSRELDDFQLRLGDGEEGTLKSGTRYPIMTSSFSSLGAGNLKIPGLSQPGTSGSLGSLLSSLSNTVPNVPQVQYEDLGLVLKARPRVLRSGNVALTLDLKISALAGEALNNVPVLANRSYASVVMLRANESFVVAAEMDKNESRAVSGFPGLSEIPGLNDVTDKDVQKNYSTLLIIMTPYLVRNPHPAGHTPLMMVDRTTQIR